MEYSQKSSYASRCSQASPSERAPVVKRAVGPPPQLPVDERSAMWIELISNDGASTTVIGYLLALGTEVPSTTLSTDKGDVEVEPGSELWFSNSDGINKTVLEAATSLRWSPQVKSDISKVAHYADVAGWIDASTGLAANAGSPLVADLEGPSSAVDWVRRTVLPTAAVTFHYDNLGGGTDFYISIVVDDQKFGELIWSTSQASGNYALPDGFGESAAFDMASQSSAPTIAAAFSAYDEP